MKIQLIIILLLAAILDSCQNRIESTTSEDNSVLKFYLKNGKDTLSKIIDDRIIKLYMDEEYDSTVKIFKTEPYNSDVKLGLYGSSLVRIKNFEKAKELTVNLDNIEFTEKYSKYYNSLMLYYSWGEVPENIKSYELMFLFNYLVETEYPTVLNLVDKVVSRDNLNPFGLLSQLVINYSYLDSTYNIEETKKIFSEQTETLKLLRLKYPNWKKITEFEIYDILVRNVNDKIYNFDTAFIKIDSLISVKYHEDEYKKIKEILTRFKKSKVFLEGERAFLDKTHKRLKLL